MRGNGAENPQAGFCRGHSLRVGKTDPSPGWEQKRNKITADRKLLLPHPLNKTIVEHLLCAGHRLNTEFTAEDMWIQISLLGETDPKLKKKLLADDPCYQGK